MGSGGEHPEGLVCVCAGVHIARDRVQRLCAQDCAWGLLVATETQAPHTEAQTLTALQTRGGVGACHASILKSYLVVVNPSTLESSSRE